MDIRQRRFRLSTLFLFMTLLLLSYSCAGGPYLKTTAADPSEIEGNYTLFLHGCRFSADIENIAILAREGSGYTFEIFAHEFDYGVKKHMPADRALQEAEEFVHCHYAYWKSRLSRIVAPDGNVIGYEVRPLYSALDYGYPDVLDIDYSTKDTKVLVTVSLRRELRRPLFLDRESPFLRMRR